MANATTRKNRMALDPEDVKVLELALRAWNGGKVSMTEAQWERAEALVENLDALDELCADAA